MFAQEHQTTNHESIMKKKLVVIFAFFLLITVRVYSQKVYITQTGQHYHTASCKLVNKQSTALTLSQAFAAGKTPCDKCHPPTKESGTSKKKKAAKPKK